MRHAVAGRKLGRTTEHRLALLRNLSTALFEKERIRTTLAKAKELRPFAEKLITLAKRDTLHARRRVLRHIRDKKVVAKLFDTISPRFAQRPGGYTRILKLGPRRGDHAEMALIELVAAEPVAEAEESGAKGRKAARKRTAAKKTGRRRAAAGTEEGKPTRRRIRRKTAGGSSEAGAAGQSEPRKASRGRKPERGDEQA